jgi:hypothetical protein
LKVGKDIRNKRFLSEKSEEQCIKPKGSYMAVHSTGSKRVYGESYPNRELIQEHEKKILMEEFNELQEEPDGYASTLVQRLANDLNILTKVQKRQYEDIFHRNLKNPRLRYELNIKIITGLRIFIYHGELPDQQHKVLDTQNVGKFKRTRLDQEY